MNGLVSIAKGMKDYVLRVRHHLHERPETRWETQQTREFIVQQIREMHYEPTREDGGICVDVGPANSGKILFRADFDALPVQEKTGLECSSVIDGKMHACGHDTHVAMLLGALGAIAAGKVQPVRPIRFLFEDAEENPGTAPRPESGAECMVKAGVLKNISKAFALHVWCSEDGEPGVFLSRPGPVLGNSGRVFFKIKTSGGHVARPHAGVNALRVMLAIQKRLSSFVARHFNPVHPYTLEPAILHAGTGSNVMPAEAEAWYGFRTMLPRQEHERMAEVLLEEIREIAESMEAKVIETKAIHGHPALINTPDVYQSVKTLLTGAGQEVREIEPIMGGESFAHYLREVPGCQFMLGAHTPGSGEHHAPTFNPDESVLWKGVLFWLLLATS